MPNHSSPDLTALTLAGFGVALILTSPVVLVACLLANGWL